MSILDNAEMGNSASNKLQRYTAMAGLKRWLGEIRDAFVQLINGRHNQPNGSVATPGVASGARQREPSHDGVRYTPPDPSSALPCERGCRVPPDTPAESSADIIPNHPIQVPLNSKHYRLLLYSDNPASYYSSLNFPDSHPSLGTIQSITDRLKWDLKRVVEEEEKLPPVLSWSQTVVQPSLRLSGTACEVHGTAHLSPTVWIDCSSERVKTAIENAILTRPNLRWITVNPVVVQVNLDLTAGFATTDGPDALSLGKGLDFGDSYRLHLHLENPGDGTSACGLRIYATLTREGAVVDRRVSRLGGLLKLGAGGGLAGCSTAHGVLDMLPRDRPGHLKAGTVHPPSRPSLPRDIPASHGKARENNRPWIPIPQALMFDFIQVAAPDIFGRWSLSGHVPRARDFALFGFGDDLLSRLRNTYPGNGPAVSRTITSLYPISSVPPQGKQAVVVLGGQEALLPARILPFDDTMFISGAEFKTRRIILDAPLGT